MASGCIGSALPTASALRKRIARRLENTTPASEAQRQAARRARRPGAWAETEEVAAAAKELGVRIRIWETANGMWITFGDDTAPLVYMQNVANAHFEAMIPAPKACTTTAKTQ